MERRLAAILAADVVGYSQAMGRDEAGTLAALSRLRRELIEPLVVEHHGRIFKLMGDGILAEFASVVDAVACAVAWQAGMAGDGLQFRIGVNLGDVMHQDGDIYGNGVNVAARLEGLAQPGGICVSGTVQGELRGKLELVLEDLGEQRVKNIEDPVRVWRIANRKGETAPSPPAPSKPGSLEKASVAVLPFTNLSGDPEQEYFSDGITEDIITELSRFPEMLVIARNSSFTFKGKAVNVKEVSQTLGVAYVVEGCVRKAGGRVRITAQLISADSGEHVWAERYDRDLKDVFELQDEVAGTVATTVAGRVGFVARERVRRRPTENLSAYDHVLRAQEFFPSYHTNAQAEPFLREAVRLDPRFALAQAYLAMVMLTRYFDTYDRHHLEEAYALAKTALSLDQGLAWAHAAMGNIQLNRDKLDEAGTHLQRAATLNPNDTNIRAQHALWLTYEGRTDLALNEIEVALRRDPFAQDWCWDILGIALLVAERYADAIAAYGRMSQPPRWAEVYLAICHEHLGQRDKALACLQRIAGDPHLSTVAGCLRGEVFRDPAVIARFAASLRRLGLPER
jgi:adenylate cyclase